jgi:hypothetical protein
VYSYVTVMLMHFVQVEPSRNYWCLFTNLLECTLAVEKLQIVRVETICPYINLLAFLSR